MMAELGDHAADSPVCGEILLSRPASSDMPAIDCVLEGSNSGYIALEETWNKTPLMEALDDLYTPVSSTSLPGDDDYEGSLELSVSQWRVQGSQVIKMPGQSKQSKNQLSVSSSHDIMMNSCDAITLVPDCENGVESTESFKTQWHEQEKFIKGLRLCIDNGESPSIAPDSTNGQPLNAVQSPKTIQSGHLITPNKQTINALFSPRSESEVILQAGCQSMAELDSSDRPLSASSQIKLPVASQPSQIKLEPDSLWSTEVIAVDAASPGIASAKKIFPCSICGMCFDNLSSLTSHVVNHALCRSCGLVFRDAESLELHRKVHHDNSGDKKVPSIKITPATKIAIASLAPSKQSSPKPAANKTGLKILTKSKKIIKTQNIVRKDLKMDRKVHTNSKATSIKVVCDVCKKSFRNPTRLLAHARAVHYKCGLCDKQCSSNDQLCVHEREIHFKCAVCGWIATNGLPALEKHESLHIQCLQCKARFKNHQALAAHHSISCCASEDMVAVKAKVQEDHISSSARPKEEVQVHSTSEEPCVDDRQEVVPDEEEQSQNCLQCLQPMEEDELDSHRCSAVSCSFCEITFSNPDGLKKHQLKEHFECTECEVIFKNFDSLSLHEELQHFCCAVCKTRCSGHDALSQHKRHCHVKCKLCKVWFEDWAAQEKHEALGPFPCGECYSDFCTLHSLRLHEKETHLLCSICQVFCDSREELLMHIHHPCHLCGLEFNCSSALQDHNNRDHPQCSVCGGIYRDTQALEYHCSVQHPKFKCPNCSEIFDCASKLKCHIDDNHPQSTNDKTVNMTQPKDLAAKHSSTNSDMETMTTDDEENYPLDISINIPDYLLKQEGQRESHTVSSRSLPLGLKAATKRHVPFYVKNIHKHSKKANYRPAALRRSSEGDLIKQEPDHISARSALSESEAVNGTACKSSKSRLWPCDACDKVFNLKRNLRAHVRRVHSDKVSRGKVTGIYTCSLCCTVFSSKQQLAHHKPDCFKMRDSKNGRVVCNVCGKSFSTSGNLAQHKRIHTSERPYKCDTCGKTFAQNGTLYRHKTVHTKETPFACQVCGKQFGLKGNLVMHLRNIHKIIHKSDTGSVS